MVPEAARRRHGRPARRGRLLLPREGHVAAGAAPCRAAGHRQPVLGGLVAGAPEAGAVHAGATNLQQAVEPRDNAGFLPASPAPTWSWGVRKVATDGKSKPDASSIAPNV